jgi:hypothetical protein
MKKESNGPCDWRTILLVCAMIVATGLACGCQTLFAPRPPPVTVDQIVAMSKSGESPKDIIEKMRASGSTYGLKASELADLRAQGVSDDVINYMQQTHEDALRYDYQRRDWFYGPFYPYGYPYYGWPSHEVIVIQQQPQPAPPPKK